MGTMSGGQATLCWHCQRDGLDCIKPVEGWDAVETEYKSNGYRTNEVTDKKSWCVFSCPNFLVGRRKEEQKWLS